MDPDTQILAEVLMEDAQRYLRLGMLDEAAEIMAVAEAMEFGADPFCDLNVADPTDLSGH